MASIPQPKDTNWLNGSRNKFHLYAANNKNHILVLKVDITLD